MSSSTLRVATVGLSNKTETTLKMFLEKKQDAYNLVSFNDAPDCVIFDLDQPTGRAQWHHYLNSAQRSPRASILLSLSGYGDADCKRLHRICTLLKKPVRLRQLHDALARILERKLTSPGARDSLHPPGEARRPRKASRAATGGIPDKATADTSILDNGDSSLFQAATNLPGKGIPVSYSSAVRLSHDNIQGIKNAQYNPGQYLQGYLEKILDENQASENAREVLHIATIDGPITLHLGTGKASIHLSKYRFRTLCSLPHDGISPPPWRLVDDPPAPSGNPHKKQTSIESLLWVTAIWAARGRFPRDLDPNKPVHLRHWPNLTRLTSTPHATRITALWSQDDYSLLDTAVLLGIDQRHVFTYASACQALKLLEYDRRQSTDSPRHPRKSQAPHKHRSLLGRLLARMSIFSRESDE